MTGRSGPRLGPGGSGLDRPVQSAGDGGRVRPPGGSYGPDRQVRAGPHLPGPARDGLRSSASQKRHQVVHLLFLHV